MKFKKYLYLLLLIFVIGINRVEASQEIECYYVDSYSNMRSASTLTVAYDFAVPFMHFQSAYASAYFDSVDEGLVNHYREEILNWFVDFNDNATGMKVNKIYENNVKANTNPDCPAYLVMRARVNNSGSNTSFGAFAFTEATDAKKFSDASSQIANYKAWVLSFNNASGARMTKEEYYSRFKAESLDIGGKEENVDCDSLFGSKDDPKSIAYIIDTILGYVRIIAPILVILFGTIDLARAVIASKEDEMKKAQQKFIRRLIIGVAVFLVPVLVDIIMWLADIVWEGLGYSTCRL